MEKLIEVKAHKVVQICDECGEELIFTGDALLSNPERYLHRCPKCGNTYYFFKSYPCIEYR